MMLSRLSDSVQRKDLIAQTCRLYQKTIQYAKLYCENVIKIFSYYQKD